MGILIVGDGDFSFTKSIVNYIQSECNFNIISTCYESYEEIITKYSQSSSNMEFIQENGVSIVTSIDATSLSKYEFSVEFDLIIFNFPHIGGKSNIKNNRNLLYNFFKSVKDSRILNVDGLICVSLCQGQAGTNIDINDRIFENSWQIEEMAAQSDYFLYDVRSFDLSPFGDYIPTGFRSQEKRFRLEGARTYVFKQEFASNSTDRLISEINLKGKTYFVASWIEDYLKKNYKFCDKIANDIVEVKKENEFTEICWNYVIDYDYKNGYNIIEKKSVCCSSDEVSKICVLGNNVAHIPHYKLSNSPWQQVIYLVLCSHSSEMSTKLMIHGECFLTCDQSSDYPVIKYFLSIQESCAKSHSKESQFSLDPADTNLLSENRMKIISLTKTETSMQTNIEYEEKIYFIEIINISQSIYCDYQISYRNGFAYFPELTGQSICTLDSIFPTFYTEKSSNQTPLTCSEIDRIRLLSQRTDLDFHIFRDLSFWWKEEHCSITDLLYEISEICRCVFRSHENGCVSLVDDYQDAVREARGICVRMYMRSGVVPLSRMKINKLQSIVRLHCQNIFKIVLR